MFGIKQTGENLLASVYVRATSKVVLDIKDWEVKVAKNVKLSPFHTFKKAERIKRITYEGFTHYIVLLDDVYKVHAMNNRDNESRVHIALSSYKPKRDTIEGTYYLKQACCLEMIEEMIYSKRKDIDTCLAFINSFKNYFESQNGICKRISESALKKRQEKNRREIRRRERRIVRIEEKKDPTYVYDEDLNDDCDDDEEFFQNVTGIKRKRMIILSSDEGEKRTTKKRKL